MKLNKKFKSYDTRRKKRTRVCIKSSNKSSNRNSNIIFWITNFNYYTMRLGDKLETLFRVTGIQWLVKKIYPNCNCDKRRDKLNEFKINRK